MSLQLPAVFQGQVFNSSFKVYPSLFGFLSNNSFPPQHFLVGGFKIFVKMMSSSPNRDETKQHLKPPARNHQEIDLNLIICCMYKPITILYHHCRNHQHPVFSSARMHTCNVPLKNTASRLGNWSKHPFRCSRECIDSSGFFPWFFS